MWQMGRFGPIPGQVHHFLSRKDECDRDYGLKRFSEESRWLLGDWTGNWRKSSLLQGQYLWLISLSLDGFGGMRGIRSSWMPIRM